MILCERIRQGYRSLNSSPEQESLSGARWNYDAELPPRSMVTPSLSGHHTDQRRQVQAVLAAQRGLSRSPRLKKEVSMDGSSRQLGKQSILIQKKRLFPDGMSGNSRFLLTCIKQSYSRSKRKIRMAVSQIRRLV